MRLPRAPGLFPLLAGQTVNAIGNWVAIIAVWGFAAFEFDAGPGDLALLFVVLSLPGAFLGPVLGVWIDRLGPRRALILANLAGFAVALSLVRAQSYLQVVLLALPLGLIEALAAASLDALPPRMVRDEELVTTNALLGGAQDVAIVIGPLVAAAVNLRWGLAGAFVTDALTFLVGAAVALRLRVGPVERRTRSSAWRELRDGLGLVRRRAGLRWSLSVATITYSLWALFGILEPLYVREVLGQTDTTFALFQTVFGVGLVSAGALLAVIGNRAAKPRYVALATIVSGATAALYLGTQSVAVAFVGVFLWGLDVAFFYTPVKTLLQRYAPVAAHGRVLSVNQSLEPVASIVVTPLAAVAVGMIGVQLLGVVGGVIAAVGGLVALRLVRTLPPVPDSVEIDPSAGSSRDAVALGGASPG